MKATKLVLLTLVVFSTINISSGLRAQKRSLSPDALVADLYRQHNRKRSPFFQTRSRALVNKYFNKILADLIWKDATTKKEEVGALDGDPLYDAQDMQIKNFVVGKASIEEGIAQVPVSFENFDKKVQLNFLLIKTGAGWRISDISYPGGYTLKSLLTSP
jgi:hypothetical protein